jgi:hypothetical protein
MFLTCSFSYHRRFFLGSQLLEAMQARTILGQRMWNFFVTHNQQRLPVLNAGKFVNRNSGAYVFF